MTSHMDIRKDYTRMNARVWDQWSEEGDPWTIPISHDDFIRATHGQYLITLTCQKAVPPAWYLPIKGQKLLGLASGGAQQMPVFAALGADVTVFDYSDRQLEAEKMVAAREGYAIQIVKGDMSKTLPFGNEVFDIIFNPVSVCFVREVEQVWQECFRVLKPGGILMSGFGNPMEMSLDENDQIKRKLPYDPIANSTDAELEVLSRNDGILFSHSLDTLVGGQARANLCLTDLYEDYHFGSTLVPTYIATRAMKKLW